MSIQRDRVINGIILREGGYVDDSSDSGGKTNYGITEAVARSYGYDGDMRSLPRKTAFEIYTARYWDAMLLDRVEVISGLIAGELADTAVNMGVSRAGTFLQRSLNALNDKGQLYSDVMVDGAIGNRTLEALGLFIARRGDEGMIVLHRMLNALQGAFYVELAERREKDERFIYGWFKERIG